MTESALHQTVLQIVADDKGLLAMDESIPSCYKRFAALGIPQTDEMRRQYRELIVTAPGLANSIGGAILAVDTMNQTRSDGVPFAQALHEVGIIPGVKLDQGTANLPGHATEKMTKGLDALRDQLKQYGAMGARFAKWRAVITIGDGIPSRACLEANAMSLAHYAGMCQEAGIVPIVEPEVLMDGTHTMETCREVTERTLHTVFDQLVLQGVLLEGMILKPNMVLPALDCPVQESVDQVAEATVTTLLRCVPPAVPAVAFLSGGQPAELASQRLNAMNRDFRSRMPWALTFSYSRAVQQPALELWRGDASHVAEAQVALVHRAAMNRAARGGKYDSSLESAT